MMVFSLTDLLVADNCDNANVFVSWDWKAPLVQALHFDAILSFNKSDK